MTQDERPSCRCGHGLNAHEHLRRGSDCALCGPSSCSGFRTVSPRWAKLSWRVRTPATGVDERPLAVVIAFPQPAEPARRSA